jgi:hypothetical protein
MVRAFDLGVRDFGKWRDFSGHGRFVQFVAEADDQLVTYLQRGGSEIARWADD